MKRALVTGSLGFVGKYLRSELEDSGYTVVGLDVLSAPDTLQANILDYEGLRVAVAEAQPDAVFHLAGQADVGKSWVIPQKTFEINVIGTINLMEAVLACNPSARMVIIGSSDQYGSMGILEGPVSEDMPMNPQSPYAVSKRAQEDIARVYAQDKGLHICMTRSFNHGGAGQRQGFLIPDLAAGIVRVERGLADKLLVGNLSSRRDFTHVKDVVRAYRLLAEMGEAGEIYNVGSGTATSAQDILDRMLTMATCHVLVEQDQFKIRPSDTPVICCDNSKLRKQTGWEPELTLSNILRETLAYFREKEFA